MPNGWGAWVLELWVPSAECPICYAQGLSQQIQKCQNTTERWQLSGGGGTHFLLFWQSAERFVFALNLTKLIKLNTRLHRQTCTNNEGALLGACPTGGRQIQIRQSTTAHKGKYEGAAGVGGDWVGSGWQWAGSGGGGMHGQTDNRNKLA